MQPIDPEGYACPLTLNLEKRRGLNDFLIQDRPVKRTYSVIIAWVDHPALSVKPLRSEFNSLAGKQRTPPPKNMGVKQFRGIERILVAPARIHMPCK
jgi:hypothetical protein